MNGYRLTAWFTPMEMRYITLAITPAAPDTLGGTSYTFGLTDLRTRTIRACLRAGDGSDLFHTCLTALKLVAPSSPTSSTPSASTAETGKSMRPAALSLFLEQQR